MHRHDVPDAQEAGGGRGLEGAHDDPVADGQEGQVGAVEFADEPHVSEDARVAGVVELRAAFGPQDVCPQGSPAYTIVPSSSAMLEACRASTTVMLIPPSRAVPPFCVGITFSMPLPCR